MTCGGGAFEEKSRAFSELRLSWHGGLNSSKHLLTTLGSAGGEWGGIEQCGQGVDSPV